ncbi:MAG: diaminopimelate epimerase, partial [Pseudomonadota bacterium]
NDIVVLDLRQSAYQLSRSIAAEIAGAGPTACDQLMVLHAAETPGTDGRIRIFNTDGSSAQACGNGMRCVVRVLNEGNGNTRFRLETDAGILACQLGSDDLITVDMGEPRTAWHEIPLRDPFHDTRHIELQIGPMDAPILHSPSVVSMGNPHAVFWVDDISGYDLGRVGPMLETHPIFPEGANITLAALVAEDTLKIATWERGAGLTRACGSAACAAAVSAARTRRTSRSVTIHAPGGTLLIRWRDDNHVLMTGPTEHEHAGTLSLASQSHVE